MIKIKPLITNCWGEIISLLDRVRGKGITHIIITGGKKIKCYDSIELFSDETKIVVITSLIGLKKKIITIDYDKIDYICEKYDDDIWNSVMNITCNTKEEIVEDRLYG